MPLSQMARRMATAFGSAVAVGAAQLGIGYSLGVFSWLPTVSRADDPSWHASLAWTVWIAATSVVAGSLFANRGVGLPALSRLLLRVGIVLSAALGGGVVALLISVPARAAQRADTFAPEVIVVSYAIAGVLFGLAVSLAAVHLRAVAANIVATTAYLWLLAAVAFTDALAADRKLSLTELGEWQVSISGPVYREIYLPGAAMSLGAALVIGAFAAWAGGNRVGAAFSGAAGPLLVAGAYALTTPSLSAQLFAPLAAVLVGLIGSVAATGLSGRRSRRGSDIRPSNYNQPAITSAPEPKVAGDAV